MKRGAVVLVALAVLSVAAPARAYLRTTAGTGGPCLFWSTRGHSFMIDAQGTPDVPAATAFDAIRRSFQTWAGVSCSDLTFPELGISQDAADRKVGYVQNGNNRNLVLWRTANCRAAAPPGDACLTSGGCGNKYDCWDHDDKVIAVTTTTFNRTTGQIYDADIELNSSPHSDGSRFIFTANNGPACVTPPQTGCVRYDIQNTVTHEAGHSIGLDHPPDHQEATMWAFAPEGEISKRVLAQDDINAICDIYPKGKPTSTCLGDPITMVKTGSGEAGGCGCSSGGSPLEVILAALGLYALRRRARTSGPAGS